MSTGRALPRAPRVLPPVAAPLVLPVVLLALVLSGLLAPRAAAAQEGTPPSAVVPSVTAAYGDVGTLAVVVARQQERLAGLSIRAAEAASARMLATRASSELADRPFPTASMVKLYLAEDVLHRARTGAVTLTDRDRAQLEVMIRSSDDPAASDLWVRFDGARAVRDVAARYGLAGTDPPRRWGQWGETTTTANDLAWFLIRLPVVAHPDDAAALLGWMGTATPIASDGFDQEFGVFGTLPEPAVKQGWMCCLSGQRHLHSVGVVDDRVVVLLSEVRSSVGWADAAAALDAAAAAVPTGL
ncbi:serine hydrolase [Geodermatophilus sp. DSM 44513]|uniref:serine hydrolase n=1 Tax=Geodermatophilus sp. DSM 44513 TaxID=1528104 RepID=UPI00127F4829|nr:serine hydrolase [Geodermatophilus sp. DSM 44513]WNV77732.1 serine hydrolase [Geodermatophilus sp. DSM 44513]